MLRMLQTIIHRLVVQDHIAPEDIVILTPHGGERSMLKPKTRLGNFVLTSGVSLRPYEIQATSIYKFKGLERRVVIITEVDNAFAFQPEIVMYVGCSRARTHLLFLIAHTAPAEIKHQIEAVCQSGQA
jgi:hypothetical protein